MGRYLAFLYGMLSYVVFLGTFLYAIGFVENLAVPKSIDTGPPAATMSRALIANLILLTIFALQHTIMARPAFKKMWMRIVPAPIERSTYVLLASLALVLLFWQWRPMTDVIWNVTSPIGRYLLLAISFMGWGLVLVSTFLINHFDLFGMKQVDMYRRGQKYGHAKFSTPVFYRIVRHPIMLGFIIAFWAAPTMTLGHLLFAAVTTAYILIAIQIEERDLVSFHGEAYEDYRREVSMIVPMPPRKSEKRAT